MPEGLAAADPEPVAVSVRLGVPEAEGVRDLDTDTVCDAAALWVALWEPHTASDERVQLTVAPAGQRVHAAQVDAPPTAKRPAAHAVQAEAPVERALYAPAAHPPHAAELVTAATAEKLPRGQAAQASAPAALPYAPEAHAVHTAGRLACGAVPYAPKGHSVQALAALTAL